MHARVLHPFEAKDTSSLANHADPKFAVPSLTFPVSSRTSSPGICPISLFLKSMPAILSRSLSSRRTTEDVNIVSFGVGSALQRTPAKIKTESSILYFIILTFYYCQFSLFLNTTSLFASAIGKGHQYMQSFHTHCLF